MGIENFKFGAEDAGEWGCRIIGERLGDYARGRLAEATRDAVTHHLHGCAACRKALAFEESLVQVGEDCMSCAVPEGFAASVLQAWLCQEALSVFRRILGFQRAFWLRLAFRVFVDPMLYTEYWVHYTFAPVRNGMAVAVLDVQEHLLRAMSHINGQITNPIKLAYRQIHMPLARSFQYFG